LLTNNISEGESTIKSIIYSEYYKERLNNTEYSKLANKFRCHGLIKEIQSDFSAAAWAYLHAAWNCDDESKDSQAIECRNSATVLFAKAKEIDKDFLSDNCKYYVLQTDILRRSGSFEKALYYNNIGLQLNSDDIIKKLLVFEKVLINKEDMGGYTMDSIIDLKS
jgi:hypothetical protein